jgi:DNA ligase-1
MKNLCIWSILSFFLIISDASIAQQVSHNNQPVKPKLQHGIHYQKVSDISQYYVSEKLDGVRGHWDGKQLLTRQGNKIKSPSWFTQHWPTFPIDGELWLDRGQFQRLMSCVSKHHAETNKQTSCWQHVRFMMFDLPHYKGDFSGRVKKMQALSKQVPSPYLAMINQVLLKDIAALDTKLDTVIAAQGEGLMLHLASAYYQQGRNPALMKLKKHQDAEAIIIGHTKGKGKYQGKLGAIKVKTPDGVIFKIGSGFSDYQRANPPALGTIITFKYNGLTQAGIPRFARFWRVKTPQ